jgi:hypothetical protein
MPKLGVAVRTARSMLGTDLWAQANKHQLQQPRSAGGGGGLAGGLHHAGMQGKQPVVLGCLSCSQSKQRCCCAILASMAPRITPLSSLW